MSTDQTARVPAVLIWHLHLNSFNYARYFNQAEYGEKCEASRADKTNKWVRGGMLGRAKRLHVLTFPLLFYADSGAMFYSTHTKEGGGRERERERGMERDNKTRQTKRGEWGDVYISQEQFILIPLWRFILLWMSCMCWMCVAKMCIQTVRKRVRGGEEQTEIFMTLLFSCSHVYIHTG